MVVAQIIRTSGVLAPISFAFSWGIRRTSELGENGNPDKQATIIEGACSPYDTLGNVTGIGPTLVLRIISNPAEH